MIDIAKESPAALTQAGAPLDELEVVLGWRSAGQRKARGLAALRQAVTGPRGVDLDAAALACNADGGVISACSVDDLEPFRRGALVHGGDDKGKSKESGETISMKLSALPGAVEAVVLTLTSFAGQGFDQVNQTSLEVFNGGNLVAETYIPINEDRKNAALMAVIRRTAEDRAVWEIQEIGTLVYVDPNFGGNRDGQVNWRDLGEQHRRLFRVRR